MDNFAEILKDCIQMEFGTKVETFFSKKKTVACWFYSAYFFVSFFLMIL